MSNSKVTICCSVYNQADYVESALNGFLGQDTNFAFNVVVHDDASTDGTVDILRKYESLYPDVLTVIYEIENQYSKPGYRSGNHFLNYISGDYVALCEGDDFWISRDKLQRQFDYMESHPECALCGHSAFQVRSDDSKVFGVLPSKEFYCIDYDFTLAELIHASSSFIPTCSLFFRSDVYMSYLRSDFRVGCPVGDYPSRIFAGIKGTVHFDGGVYAAKREASVGSFSSRIVSDEVKCIDMYSRIIKWLSGVEVNWHSNAIAEAIDNEIRRLSEIVSAYELVIDCKENGVLSVIRPGSVRFLSELPSSLKRETIKRILLSAGYRFTDFIVQKRLGRRFSERRAHVLNLVCDVMRSPHFICSQTKYLN